MIDPTDWAKVKAIFDAAIRLAGESRDHFVAEACGTHSALRHELDSLLAAYDSDKEFLETPALPGTAELIAAGVPDAQAGRRIGPYLLKRRIGEGGMGVVYEATRADGEFQQRVAIKLVKRGMDSDYILRRFRNERQILAGLTHPNIGKLLDGGAAEDGSPYFVIEFIEGQLIDDYCRARRLSALQCVELVHQVCSALEYAHRQHVIHRDIKPGNIMVDLQGTPKLLDFGIAKLTGFESGQSTQRTLTEWRMITPEYASPEQTRGEPATERSDVYALGVVLFELVTGHRPGAAAGAAALDKLPRDLRLVIHKAMHLEPERRYPGMTELAADLQKFLSGSPVSARPDSVFYRLSRSLQRNSRYAWGASLVLVAVLAVLFARIVPRGGSFSFSSARRSIAVIEFQNITGAAGSAWLSTALTEMLSAEMAAGGKIRTIPGDSVAQMKSDLALQLAGSYSPSTLRRIAANLHPDYIIAGSYLATGDKPDMLVRVDLRLQDVASGDSLLTWTDTGTPAELPAIATRAGVKLRQALRVPGGGSGSPKFANPESVRLYAEGLERIRGFDPLGARAILERAIAEDPSDSLSHSALASALAQLGYQDRAADEAKRAIDLSAGLSSQQRLEVEARYYSLKRDWARAASTYGTLWKAFPDDLDYAIGMANAQSNGGNVGAARQTIATIRREPIAAVDPRVDLAEALAADIAGDSRQELELARRASSIARQSGAAQILAESLYYEAWAQWLLGNLSASEQAYAQALNIFAEAGNQRRVVDMKSGLAAVLLDEGKALESARMLEEALRITRKLGDRALEGAVNNNLGRCWQDLGQLKRAQAAYEQSALIDRELNDRTNLAIALLNVGGVVKDQGEFGEARRITLQCLELARAIGRKSTIALALSNLAEGSQALGYLSEASQFQSEALAVARDIGRKTAIASALNVQASILRSQARWQESEAKYREAAKVASDAAAPGRLADIQLEYAQLLIDQGRLESASKLARQSLDEFQKEKSDDGEALVEAVLAQIRSRQGDGKEGELLARQARGHLGTGEVLATRLLVENAEAAAALAQGKRTEAVGDLRRLASEATAKGLRETAWEAELTIAAIEATASARARALQIKRQAASCGLLRIARLSY